MSLELQRNSELHELGAWSVELGVVAWSSNAAPSSWSLERQTLLVVVMAERYLVQLGQNTMQHNPCLSKALFASPTTEHSHLTPVKKEMLLLQEHCKRE
jgi:hypothetical protein